MTEYSKPYAPDEEDSLFSDQCADFIEAVECLYVFDNISARNKFRQDWPHAAEHIFSPELNTYDLSGEIEGEEDKNRLETHAEIARGLMIEELETVKGAIEANDVVTSDQISALLGVFGIEAGRYIFAPVVIERFQSAHSPQSAPTEAEPQPSVAPEPVAVKPGESGLNLAQRKRLVEVAPLIRQGVTYADLLKKLETETPSLKDKCKIAFNTVAV